MTYSLDKLRTTIRIDPEIWRAFCIETRRRGSSSCPVLETLMLAYLQGMARTGDGSTTVVVNLTMQHVVERPRRIRKLEDILNEGGSKNWPPCCKFADAFWKGPREVGCLKVKDMVPLDRCWRCYLVRGFDDLSNGNEGVGP